MSILGACEQAQTKSRRAEIFSCMRACMQTTLLRGKDEHFLVKVKKILAEKDIPSDHGYRELGRIASLQKEKSDSTHEVVRKEDTGTAPECSEPGVYVVKGETSYHPRSFEGGRYRTHDRYAARGFGSKRGRYFICSSTRPVGPNLGST